MRNGVATYAWALAALVAAVALRWALDPLLGDSLPLVTLFGALAATVWVGGLRPAVVVAVAGYIACDYLFIAPRGHLDLGQTKNVVGFIAYLATCALIIGFGEATRSARARVATSGEIVRVTLGSIGDGVIATDTEARITYLNAVAETLTGWTTAEALGKPLDTVFRIVGESTREPQENPASRSLREGRIVGLANHTILIAKDGVERPIDDSAAPIKDEQGLVSGCVLIFRDISERRRWERDEAGRSLTARFLASIVESSDDAIISKSLDGIIQSWNASAERLFGHTAEQAVGRHISLVIPPERIAEEDQIIASLKAGRRIEHFETERVRRDGGRIRVSLTISPIKDPAGAVVGASKIVRDVTRQRQAEERERNLLAEAAAANAKFRAFFDQGALFAGIMDIDGTLVDANRLSWEGCGFTRDQVLGKPFWEGPWWKPDAALVERIKAGTAEAAAGKMFQAEMPYYVADGSERVVDVMILPIKDESGRILFLAPTGTDITDRKLAESERQKFVTLVESSTDFIGISDLQGVPFYINSAGLRLVGLADMAEARRIHVRDFFFPEDQARIMEEFFPQVLAKGHAETEVRFRNFATGQARWMAYKALMLKDAAGNTSAFATVSQDVTERRRLEDDLRKMTVDLAEVDRRKDEFLATLSHELRNPLAPLRSMVEILKRGSRDTGTLTHALDTMEAQLGQLVRLVDDLLDLSRITHNRIELRKNDVDLATVIRQAIAMSRPLAEASGQAIEVSLPSEPIYVHADAVRLTQVFGNLLNNSCKYTPRGGRIEIAAELEGAEAVVRVKDTGTGIAADKLEIIFDMFTQIDRSLERSQGGLGIGLTLVKRLVQMHGGTVDARSEGEGKGSEFIVRLPTIAERLAPARDANAPPQDAHSDESHSRRILVVDDNRDAASSLAMLLQITGNETFTAYDGEAALEAIATHRPEVVLLDIGMPKVNGYEVCRRVRSEPWGKNMLIIALTGWGQEEDRRRTREAGFDGHLVKPVDYAAVMTLLSSLAPERNPG